MATKIRLQRRGRKGRPFYQIIVADSRSPRDGKVIDRIGTYDPNTNPATINLNFDNALSWLQKGAQPTDTARAILSYKGVLYKNHLLKGVKKGAFDEAKVEELFNAWLEDKNQKIEGKKEAEIKSRDEAKQTSLADEKKKREEKAKEIAAKNTPPAQETEEGEEAAETTEATAETEETPQATSEEEKTEE